MVIMQSERKTTSMAKPNFTSRFIPTEKMPVLIEKIRRVEANYSHRSERVREAKASYPYCWIAIKGGLDGQFKKSFKRWLIFGVPFYALTNQYPETLLKVAILVGAGSLTTATMSVYKEIMEDFRRIRTEALKNGSEKYEGDRL